MIIDAHSHLGHSWCAYWTTHIDEDEFIRVMDQLGVDKNCVSYWGINYDPDVGNERVAKFMQKYPDRIIGFACIVPHWWEKAVDEIEKAKELGFKGLKFHPAINHWYADSPMVYPCVEKAIELGMPMLFHSGADQYSHPRNLGNLAQRYKEATFIMGHMGEEAVFEGIQVARVNENIILDTTGSFNWYDIVKHAVNVVGEDRIVMGLDFPAYNPYPELSKVKDANITDRQKEKIMGENMARILGLK